MVVAIGNVADTVLADRRGSECVSTITVDLRHDATAECERSKGVVVCEKDDSVDELCEGPAVLLCLQKLLKYTEDIFEFWTQKSTSVIFLMHYATTYITKNISQL